MTASKQRKWPRASAALMDEARPARRWAMLADAMASIGLDQIHYGFFNRTAENDYDGASSAFGPPMMHADWMVHYGLQRDALDGHGRLSAHVGNFSPMSLKYGSGDDGGAYGIYRMADRPDLRSGLLIPLPGPFRPGHSGAAILVGANLPDAQFRKIVDSNAMALVSAAHLFHADSVGELIRLRDRIPPLTRREKDCLQLAAAGLRVKEIALRIALAPVTVELHLRNARRKFHCLTISETVARALLYQQISHN